MAGASQWDAIDAAIDATVDDAVRIIATNATAILQSSPPEGTPVDTGNARAQWLPTIGEPASAPAFGPAAAALSSQAVANLQHYKAADGVVYVCNPTPYIERLNNGSSQQSPAGFVQAAAEQAASQASTILANRAAGRGRR